jgi:DnaJ-class molecular chaperone
MSQIIKHVTQSVSKIVTPEFVSKMNGNGDNMITMKKSHNKSKSKPRHKTKDIEYNLDVTLEDIYFGKQKKIGVRVKRVNESGEYIDEKIKLVVDIKPGMRGGEIVKFEGQSDHREGYLPGDININLNLVDNDDFMTNGDDIIYEKTVSLTECYKLGFTFTHIDGTTYRVSANDLTFNESIPFRKIVGLGMPVVDDEDGKEFGDLILKLNYDLPLTLTEEQLETLSTVFPPVADDVSEETIIAVDGLLVSAEEIEDLYETDEDDEDDEDEEDDDDVVEEED